MKIKMDKDTKRLMEEIAAVSGIKRDVVKEVWEYTLIRWVEEISRDPQKLNRLLIPFLGSVAVKYEGEVIEEASEKTNQGMEPKTTSFVALSKPFEDLMSTIYTNKNNVITQLLDAKIQESIGLIVDEI